MKISTPIGSDEYKIFEKIIKDEGFKESSFKEKSNKLVMVFKKEELPLLVKKLKETQKEIAVNWAENISMMMGN